MGGSVHGILVGAVGADGMIGAVLQVLLESPAGRQARVTLGLEVRQVLLECRVAGGLHLLEAGPHVLDHALVPLRIDLRRSRMRQQLIQMPFGARLMIVPRELQVRLVYPLLHGRPGPCGIPAHPAPRGSRSP